jgi:hypothetical protein
MLVRSRAIFGDLAYFIDDNSIISRIVSVKEPPAHTSANLSFWVQMLMVADPVLAAEIYNNPKIVKKKM